MCLAARLRSPCTACGARHAWLVRTNQGCLRLAAAQESCSEGVSERSALGLSCVLGSQECKLHLPGSFDGFQLAQARCAVTQQVQGNTAGSQFVPRRLWRCLWGYPLRALRPGAIGPAPPPRSVPSLLECGPGPNARGPRGPRMILASGHLGLVLCLPCSSVGLAPTRDGPRGPRTILASGRMGRGCASTLGGFSRALAG